MITLDPTKIVIALIIIAMTLLPAVYIKYNDLVKFNTYKNTITSLGKQQEETIKLLNQQLKDNNDESTKNLQTATNSLNDYYVSHPATKWVRNTTTCSSQVSKSDVNFGNTTNTSTTEDNVTYQSAYTEQETETIALQLDELLTLLNNNGVKHVR